MNLVAAIGNRRSRLARPARGPRPIPAERGTPDAQIAINEFLARAASASAPARAEKVPSLRPRVAVKMATVRRLVKTGWAQRCLRTKKSPKERGVLNHSAQKKSELNRTETLNRYQPNCRSAQKFSTELQLSQPFSGDFLGISEAPRIRRAHDAEACESSGLTARIAHRFTPRPAGGGGNQHRCSLKHTGAQHNSKCIFG